MKENIKKVKIGFVGCGNMSTSGLYPTIHTIPEIDLVAVCDLKEDLAKRNARNFGAKAWYTDVEQMLSQEKLDGAMVVGPPQMHCEVGKQCLDANLPIYVEKPSAVSSKEAMELAQYAQERNLFGAVGYMKRSATCYRMAKEITEREEFGKISEIEMRFSYGGYSPIWGIKEGSHAFLIGQVIHLFNLIRFFCGEVDEVYARLNQVDEEHFGYAITVAFKNGVVGVMNLNALECWEISEYVAVSGYRCWLEVKDMTSLSYYPKGKLLPTFEGRGRSQKITWQPTWVELCGNAFGYRAEVQNFARAILGEEKPRADLLDAAKDLQLAEAVWESAQRKKVIRISKYD